MPPTNPAPTSRLPTWIMGGLIFGLVLACYWPALRGTQLWDDPAHIPRPELRSWAGLERIWTDVHATQQYYPILFSAFWFEYHLWGDATLGYHLVNVLLHAMSCCLLALALRRLWAMLPAAAPSGAPAPPTIPAGAEWLAAALFAVHPVCVESVAWITEQKNTLSTAFYLAAGLCYLGFFAGRRKSDYALASGLFLLALGSKTATVTLPAALLVVFWWKNGSLSWRRDILPLLPWFAAALAMGLFTSWDERKIIGAEGAPFDLSAPQRFLLAGRTVWFYLGKLAWPTGLNFFYPRWDVVADSTRWIGYLAAAVAMTAIFWFLRKKSRGPLAAWLLFIGALFPVLGFFNVYFFVFSYVNDHFQYLAIIAPIAAASGGVALAIAAAPSWTRLPARLGLIALVGVLAALANSQSRLYRDSETLFRTTIALNPSSWMAHHILGFTLAKAPDRHDEAMTEFRAALALHPEYPDAHFALGVELARLPGRKPEAIAEYEQAVKLRPVYAEAHNNLALELAKMPGREPDAIAHFEAALKTKPDFAEAHANLADLLARQPEHLPEALSHYEEALRINPNLAWVHCNLALHLAQLPGQATAAIAHCEAALRLRPDFLEAHNCLGIIYARQGSMDRARTEWETALRINPNYESARNNLRQLDQIQQR